MKFTSTTQFRRDLKLARKRGLDIDRVGNLVDMLLRGETLSIQYQDHALIGPYLGTRECHIAPDWLLIYRVTDEALIAIRTGTHADLFNS